MMRTVLLVLAVSLLAASPVLAAATAKDKGETTAEKRDRLRENWPTAKEIDKAQARVAWNTENTATAEFRNKKVIFIPTKLGDISDEARAKGVVLGKLETKTESKDGLAAGEYVVYARKEGTKWEVYFCQKGEPVAKSKTVLQNQADRHEPKFDNAGAAIHYWELKWDW
jgi:hypothetical protein